VSALPLRYLNQTSDHDFLLLLVQNIEVPVNLTLLDLKIDFVSVSEFRFLTLDSPVPAIGIQPFENTFIT
jgi:hypothetical protein